MQDRGNNAFLLIDYPPKADMTDMVGNNYTPKYKND